jgi:hypothetical protein
VAEVVMLRVAVAAVAKLDKLRKVPTPGRLVPPVKDNTGAFDPSNEPKKLTPRLTGPAQPLTAVSVIVGLALPPCTMLTELELRLEV